MNGLNVAMLLDHQARRIPDDLALVDARRRMTFGEAADASQRLSQVLLDLGIQTGDRLMLALPNRVEFVLVQFAALRVGAVVVPVHPSSPAPEIEKLLHTSKARLLIVDETALDAARQAVNVVDTCDRLLMVDGAEGSELTADESMAGLMAGAEPMTEPADTRPDDPALILFTSGTIGEQKGVVLSHFNIFLQGSYMAETFWEVGPDDVVLMVAPGAHLFGQTLIHVAARAQAPLVMLNGFQPVAFLSAIQDEGVTFFAGVPTILHFMLNQPSVGDFDLSSLRKVMIGGAPLHPQVAREFEDRFEAKVITGYGLTEGVPLSYLAAEDMQDAPAGSIGRASLGTTLRVVDEQGDDVLPGEPGEIVARSPFLFQAYYGRPDLTEQSWRGGWFHTGDIGLVDPNGYFFLIDRLKDVIKRKGYSVYPAEVEQVLMSHPAVSGAGVVGVPDEALGEEVKAVVTLRQGKQATEEELISYCKERLAAYKYPRRIEFRDKLPMNPSGKVLRRALRGA